MGTPGDKASISEVVKTEPPLPAGRPPERECPPPETDRPQQLPPLSQDLQRSAALSLPGTSNAEMGVIDRTPPQFHQQAYGRPGLSYIDDYYSQTKYQHPSHAFQSKQKTFPSTVDPGPGPSGLQTPKTKTATTGVSATKVKKSRKPVEEPVATPTAISKEHKCRDCHKGFATPEKLAKHQQTHTGSSPFKCDNCKKLFTSKFKLVRHALIHSDRKPFSCTVCDRTFHRKDHLKNHIKVHSPSKEVFECNSCKKRYTSSLRKHRAFHSAEEGNLTCQMCFEDFGTKDEILYHLKIHAGSRTVKNPNEKKFTCEQCDRKFFTKKDVRRHLVVHTGKRDFLCQYCPQRFGRKDHLVRHIKKAHSGKYKPNETATTAAVKSETASTIKQEDEAIKTEVSESSFSNAVTENFGTALGIPLENISDDTLTTLLEGESLGLCLPSASDGGELEDLGNTILEDIVGPDEPTGIMLSGNLDASQDVLDEVVLQRFLEVPGDKNLPLPGFSQTFQSPPPGSGTSK